MGSGECIYQLDAGKEKGREPQARSTLGALCKYNCTFMLYWHIHTYIHVWRERERERTSYTGIYIYI